MGKVKKFKPISATCKDCGRDFIITVEEQKRFKSLGFELPKRCCECRKKRKEEKRVAEAKIKEKQEILENEKRQKKWEKEEKAIELAKKEWGENDSNVTYNVEQKEGNVYYIAVRLNDQVQKWYEVNTEKWTIQEY